MIKKNPLRTLLNQVEKIFFVIQAVCLYASVGTVVITVLARELFRISLVWGYEIACWFVIILLFLGMARNLHHRGNLAVTFIFDIANPMIQKVLRVIHFLVEVVVIWMMAVGFQTWITKVGGGKLPASGFTNIQYYGIIGAGILFSALELVCEIIDLMVKKEEILTQELKGGEERVE